MNVLNKILKSFLGDKNQKDLKEINPILANIKKAETAIENISNDELRAKTESFKIKIQEALKENNQEIEKLKIEVEQTEDFQEKEAIFDKIETIEEESYQITQNILNEILPEAFAVVKETAKRFVNNSTLAVKASAFDREISGKKEYVTLQDEQTAIWKNNWDAAGKAVIWDMIHYDVQFIGGTVLHQGKIAEMATGEGKTLVATLPVYLNALSGKGVHLVTVNDYLARRDSAWMAPIFEFHGLSVDCIDNHQPNSPERRKAYLADITYGTNNEFGFDYLRDNMAGSPEGLVQRKHNFAIVDEVDSVLVDDARTPLIISGPVQQEDRQEYDVLKPKVESLYAIQRNEVSGIFNEAKQLIADGDKKEGGKKLLQVHRGLPKYKPLIKFLSEEGNKALLQKTEAHYMADNSREMPKVDIDLYFVIDEKNNSVEIAEKGIEYLSKGMDDKDFFVLQDIGTEITEIENRHLSKEDELKAKEDFFRNFAIKSERIHSLNQLLKAYTLFEKDVEYVVIDGEVKIVDEQTGRIMEGRRYSDGLHQALEAKESVKIEAATQTFATITLQNYFRMYKKLAGMTGTAETEAGEFWQIYKLDVVVIPTNKPILRDDRQDLVFKTAREKFNAVIEEIAYLTQEKHRPVLVGTTSVEISELLSRMLSMRKIQHQVLNAKLHKKEAEIVAEAGSAGVVTIATNMAGRGTDIKITDEVKKSGGLAIIGTERHDSRRVDRQLRGRAGRQGDPGSSQFYVSLEDNLMRLFGSDRIASLMDKMGHKDGDVIQHSMISKSIERAQKKVEENNFGTRKRLLDYDDVMNKQREIIYKRRRNALYGDRLNLDIANMVWETAVNIVEEHKDGNFNDFELELIINFTMESPVNEAELKSLSTEQIAEKIYQQALQDYKIKMQINAERMAPVLENVYQTQGHIYKNIQIPFSDGKKTLNVISDLKNGYESQGKSLIKDFEKGIVLALIDENWKEHLREMDDLRRSVQSASYEQKDPLVIYKQESFYLFSKMINRINKEIISFLFKGELEGYNADKIQQAKETPKVKTQEGRGEAGKQEYNDPSANKPVEITAPRKVVKIGRNDLVHIQNIQTGETKQMKYKQAERMIEEGNWVLNEN